MGLNEEYFAIICELDKEDSIKDESVWIKANPIVATYDKIEISIAKNIFIISPFFVVQYYNKKILKFQEKNT